MKQALEEQTIVRACQHGLDFTRQADGLIDGPLREESRVNHHERSLAIMEWLATKPGHQFIAVLRLQDVLNRILVSYGGNAFRCCEQEEVMIAQHNASGVVETLHEPEEGERVGATIDKVADQPHPVRPWIERNPIEEPSEWIEATLNVADCVNSHEWRVPVTG